MLYRNGENLKEGLISFLSNKNEISIFCPYIKSKTLAALLEAPGLTCKQIIVRWEPKDLAMGSSDLDIYDICKSRGITLYLNNRIHLKVFTNNFNETFLGSANISERAISDNPNKNNYEINTHVESISNDDRLYLHKILNNSTLVTDELFEKIKNQVPDINADIDTKTFDFSDITENTDDFLITKLPMIDSPELLWNLFSENLEIKNIEQNNCYCHDIALYNIDYHYDSKEDFLNDLAKKFFDLPFLKEFLKAVDSAERTTYKGEKREGLQFGAVRKWFSVHTTTVPSPRPFELTNNIQILYSWIEILSNGKYTVSVPGTHSQVLKKN